MAIYPERNKSGKLTGFFRIEVQKGKERLRGRAESMAEAKGIEEALKERLATGATCAAPKRRSAPEAAPSPTLREAADRARGTLWSGQSTEAESLRKLDRVIKLVGEGVRVDELDMNKVDELVVSLKDAGVKDSTVNRYLSCVSAFLKFCKKRGLRNVEVPEIEWRDEDEGRIRWLTYEEETRLCELLPRPYNDVVFVAIRTGLRASALLNLKEDQIEPRWVHLWGSDTKNGSSRSVPLTKEVHAVLMALVSAGMPGYWELRWAWEKAREAMGLLKDPTFVFHSCRHSYATRAVQAGVIIRVLQKLMGHKSIQTTLRYAHVDDETLADAGTKAVAFHEQKRGGIDRGKRAKFPRHAGSRGAHEPQKSAGLGQWSAPAQGLQIRLRRFDSGSGLHRSWVSSHRAPISIPIAAAIPRIDLAIGRARGRSRLDDDAAASAPLIDSATCSRTRRWSWPSWPVS